jgi:hypothetical protein
MERATMRIHGKPARPRPPRAEAAADAAPGEARQ